MCVSCLKYNLHVKFVNILDELFFSSPFFLTAAEVVVVVVSAALCVCSGSFQFVICRRKSEAQRKRKIRENPNQSHAAFQSDAQSFDDTSHCFAQQQTTARKIREASL